MTTFQDLIHETRHILMTGQPDRLNVLTSSIDNSPATTSITFTYDLNGVTAGTIICIGLEEMHVVSVSGQAAGSNATVIRAVNGSTITSHTAADIIQVNPQFSDFRISKYINQALLSLSAQGLFRILAVEFNFNPAQSGYNLNAPNLIDVWRVRYNEPGPENIWPVIPPTSYRLDQDADTTDFPQSIQILFYTGGYPGHAIRVSYRAGFTPLTALTDNVLSVSGLHTEAHDLPPLSSAIDLLAGREIKRSFLNRQPEPRRQQEVPSGSANQSMVPLLKIYKDRLSQESRRLKRRFPGTT